MHKPYTAMHLGGEGAVGGYQATQMSRSLCTSATSLAGAHGARWACAACLCTSATSLAGMRLHTETDKTKPRISPPVHSFHQFMAPPKPDSAGPFVPPSQPPCVGLLPRRQQYPALSRMHDATRKELTRCKFEPNPHRT